MLRNKLISFPWYIFFLALYAPLALLAHNLGQSNRGMVIRSLLFCVGIALLLFLGLKILVKDFL